MKRNLSKEKMTCARERNHGWIHDRDAKSGLTSTPGAKGGNRAGCGYPRRESSRLKRGLGNGKIRYRKGVNIIEKGEPGKIKRRKSEKRA